MSVRKLAVAALRRVKMLRKSLAENRAPIVRGIAMTAGIFLVSQDHALRAGDGEHLPFRDPFAFDPDFRWFEPVYDADLADMKPKKRANTGWYGSYDRMEMWLSRPEAEGSEWLLDHGSGNRYDLGYMLDEDHGWSMTYMNLGVDGYFGVNRERLNRYNIGQLATDDDATDGAQTGPPFGLPVPQTDGNNIGFNNRFVELRNSENVADFHSFELNKTWRLEPYHYGGMLEPLVGFRYMRFSDTNQRMVYNAGNFLDPYLPLDPANPPILPGEQVLTDRSEATNDMVGGQIGFRYFKFVDRFRYSTELRVFTLGNFQSNRRQTHTELTLYDDDEASANIAHYIREAGEPVYARNDEFAFGYDIRAEVGYTLTRMIELRGGFQMIDIAQGLWRGELEQNQALNRTDQRSIMAGFTFGVALNR